MAQVFIVRANGGEWEDSFSYSVKAFMDEIAAQSFKHVCIEQHTTKVRHCAKVNRWYHKWLSSNPYPAPIISETPEDIPRLVNGWEYDQNSPEWAAWQEQYAQEVREYEESVQAHRALWYKSYLLYAKSFNFPIAPMHDDVMVTGTIRYGHIDLRFYVESVELG